MIMSRLMPKTNFTVQPHKKMHINIPSRSFLEMDCKPRLRRKCCFPLKSGVLQRTSGFPHGRGKSNGNGGLMVSSEGGLSYCSGSEGLRARQRSNLRSSYSINPFNQTNAQNNYLKASKSEGFHDVIL
jgi:hypothetical protein